MKPGGEIDFSQSCLLFQRTRHSSYKNLYPDMQRFRYSTTLCNETMWADNLSKMFRFHFCHILLNSQTDYRSVATSKTLDTMATALCTAQPAGRQTIKTLKFNRILQRRCDCETKIRCTLELFCLFATILQNLIHY